MQNSAAQPADFQAVKTRLAEIADAVADDALPLDEALDLYEEAVALGLKASDLLESGIKLPEEEQENANQESASQEPESAAQQAAEDAPAVTSPASTH